jgi:hypothetical protein
VISSRLDRRKQTRKENSQEGKWTDSVDAQRDVSTGERALVRVLSVLKSTVGKGQKVRRHLGRLSKRGDLPLLGLLFGRRGLGLELGLNRLDELDGRLGRVLVLELGQRLLVDGVHVGKRDGVGSRDHGEGERRLERGLVPAGERSAGRGRFELGEGVDGLLFVLVGVGGDVVAEHAVAEIGLPSEPQADLVPFLEAESVIELDGGSFLFVVPADGRVLDLVDRVCLERGRVKGERVDGERRVDVKGEGVERLGEDFEAGRRQKTREGIGEGEERCELKGREGEERRFRQTAKRTSEGELERDEQDRA